MTVKELKSIILNIPSKEDNRPVSLCGNLLIGNEPIDDIEISWIDCSDAMLICINEQGCSRFCQNRKEGVD